jgi:RNA-directed DNA polymerase
VAKGRTKRRAKRAVGLRSKVPQMSGQLELPFQGRGETPRIEQSEEAQLATHANERSGTSGLMELACKRENLQAALKRVRRNKGSPGIDGMTVDALLEYLKVKWPELREQLLSGKYQPAAVKQQLIPKGNGGMRQLGIPKYHSNCTWFQHALGKC